MFTGAATKISFTDIFERESGAQALRRLSGFESRIFFHKRIGTTKSSDRSTYPSGLGGDADVCQLLHKRIDERRR